MNVRSQIFRICPRNIEKVEAVDNLNYISKAVSIISHALHNKGNLIEFTSKSF